MYQITPLFPVLFGYYSFWGQYFPCKRVSHFLLSLPGVCQLTVPFISCLRRPEVPKCIDLECVRATYVFQRYVILQQLTTEMLASSISNHRKNKDEMQEASNQKTLVLKHSASLFFYSFTKGTSGLKKKVIKGENSR